MNGFLNSLDGPLRIFWIIAIVATIVFVVQTIMAFAGIGGDTDFDEVTSAETVDDSGFGGLFSFRNLINFLLGYGWTGVALYDEIRHPFWLYAVCVLVGLIFIVAFVIMFRLMMRLSHDGTFHDEESLGLVADVYLRIPAARTGRGKVQFSVKGSVHELDAVTDGLSGIPTGGHVKIVEVLGDELVRVEAI